MTLRSETWVLLLFKIYELTYQGGPLDEPLWDAVADATLDSKLAKTVIIFAGYSLSVNMKKYKL